MSAFLAGRWLVAMFVACTMLSLGCDTEDAVLLDEEDEDPILETESRVLGVCFMHGEKCVSPYIDLGPYDESQTTSKTAIPVYVFPSVPSVDGGEGHPSDEDSLYNPYRLQNNVFADNGQVWEMWRVFSADLNLVAAPPTGAWLWGVDADQSADFKSGNLRDLFSNPYTSEKEILDAAESGQIKLVNLFKNVDCPIVQPKTGDTIINLNPSYPICE